MSQELEQGLSVPTTELTESEKSLAASESRLEAAHTPKKKRHVIKAKNVPVVDGDVKNSPLAKSFGLIGRLSKRNKDKTRKGISGDSDLKNEEAQRIEIKNDIYENPPAEANESEQPAAENKKTLIKDEKEIKKKSDKNVKKNDKDKPARKRNKKVSVKSHVLTDYYPVRRSSRKPKSLLEKEQHDSIIQAIKSNCEDGLAVLEFKEKGRGVVTKRAFKKGSFVVEYAGDLVDWSEAKRREQEYSKDSSVGCYMYYFVFDNTNYCVDATAESGRLGRLLNHSRKNPNCKTKLVPYPNPNGKGTLPRLIIMAKRDISAGEELTYDYGDRDKETLQSHPWLKST